MLSNQGLILRKQGRIAAILAGITLASSAVYLKVRPQAGKQIAHAAAQDKRVLFPSSDRAATGMWTPLRPMNQGAVFMGTVALPDGRIFVISGRTTVNGKRKRTNAVQVYDPRRNIWKEASPIPTPRMEAGVALGRDGKIYVIGGADPQRRQNVVESYDPRANTWARCSPMPTPREALWAVTARGADGRFRIYALGGRDRSNPGNGLRTVPNNGLRTVPNNGLRTVPNNGLRTVPNNGLRTVEAYDPIAGTWVAKAQRPTPRHALTATLGPDGRIYAIGGSNDQVFCTDAVEIYDPVKNVWSRGCPMPYGRECAAAVFTPGSDGDILVLGGWDRRSWPIAGVEAYSPRTGKWRALPPQPTAAAALGAVMSTDTEGTIHITALGGMPEETNVEEYSFPPGATRRSVRNKSM